MPSDDKTKITLWPTQYLVWRSLKFEHKVASIISLVHWQNLFFAYVYLIRKQKTVVESSL